MIKIHKAGYGIITGIAIFLLLFNTIIALLITKPVMVWSIFIISFLILLLVIRFFRYPSRHVNAPETTVVAPADGTICAIEQVFEDEILMQDCLQISIFMSVWNVHINWIPISGKLTYFRYHQGKYLVAHKPKSSTDNERTTLLIETPKGEKIVVRQIAGFVARRIETYTQETNSPVEKGQELGFIKFGSRVDILLPLSAEPLVRLGQKTKGCITPIAKL